MTALCIVVKNGDRLLSLATSCGRWWLAACSQRLCNWMRDRMYDMWRVWSTGLTPLLQCHSHNWQNGWIEQGFMWQKGKGSPYSITERRVPELIPVLGSQPAGDVSHKPSGRQPLLSARPAVTLATLKRAATNFAAWWTEARWEWTVCLRLLPINVTAAIWTQALLCPSQAR